ncbi:MAG: dephospho-CoA kinase [Aestuariivita sp.]|nr:dephospho-CoA kinase [Aestuariivita sp.]
MTIKVGLTGSIAAGKSTTAHLFLDEGCDLWDADFAVHQLYARGGAAVTPMQMHFPQAIVDGMVSREILRNIVSIDCNALRSIERIIHPLVAQHQETFLNESKADVVVFDIPLLFETGNDNNMDITVCVSIDAKTQRQRVMNRGGDSMKLFRQLSDNQLSDAEKCKRANYIIISDTIEHAKRQVRSIMKQIMAEI